MHLVPQTVRLIHSNELSLLQIEEEPQGWALIVGFPENGYSLVITTNEPYTAISAELLIGSTTITIWEGGQESVSQMLTQAGEIVLGIEATIAATLAK